MKTNKTNLFLSSMVLTVFTAISLICLPAAALAIEGASQTGDGTYVAEEPIGTVTGPDGSTTYFGDPLINENPLLSTTAPASEDSGTTETEFSEGTETEYSEQQGIGDELLVDESDTTTLTTGDTNVLYATYDGSMELLDTDVDGKPDQLVINEGEDAGSYPVFELAEDELTLGFPAYGADTDSDGVYDLVFVDAGDGTWTWFNYEDYSNF